MARSNGGIIGVKNVSSAGGGGVSTYNSNGNHCTPSGTRIVKVFFVAGGGGGRSNTFVGGGGSGGGLVDKDINVCGSTQYPIVIGGGGAKSPHAPPSAFGAAGTDGSTTTGFGQTATGGSGDSPTAFGNGGDHPGGNAGGSPGGGGGGAGGVGGNGSCTDGGDGGAGAPSTLSGSDVNYGGGGGAGSNNANGHRSCGTDGGSPGSTINAGAGSATANRGGGGGGMRSGFSCGSYRASSNGSSGVAFVKNLTKASGMWNLKSQFKARKESTWPT